MEEEQQALNDTGEIENTETESPTAETNEPELSEEATSASEPTGEEGGEVKAEDEGKKGASARIRKLANEKNELKEKYESLAEKMAKMTDGIMNPMYQQSTPQTPPPTEGTPDEITLEQYKRDVLNQADAVVSLRIKQKEYVDRVNQEANESIKTYKQLDPDSDDFDPDLSEAVTKAAESFTRQHPAESVKKFVDSMMKPYMRSLNKEVGDATENIAKQVSQSAVKPSTERAKEKSAEELSLKELENRLGVVQA